MKTVAWAGALLVLACAQAAGAQGYPNKPVRFVVPFSTGGGGDFVGTTVARRLSEDLKQPVVAENRPGGAGSAGTELVAKAAPDGYTLVVCQLAPMSIYPALHSKPAYDPVRDFAAISRLVFAPQMLVVHPSLPVKSVQDLVMLAKGKPGQLSYGSTGHGAGNHLAMEWIKAATGINLTNVRFEGVVAALQALSAGETSAQFAGGPAALSRVKSGKIRAIAVGSAKRLPDLPELPTVAESGVPDFEYTSWYGLCAPARTPKDIVAKLNSAVATVLRDPDTARQLKERGLEPSPSTPGAFAKFIREDHERWKKVVRTAGIQPK